MTTQPSGTPEQPTRARIEVPAQEAAKPAMSGTPHIDLGKASPIEIKLRKRLHQFDQVCEGSREIFEDRNREYADAISRTGVLGAAVEVVGISARFEHLVLAAPDAGKSRADELIELVKDLHNYANIMGIMIMEENWKPE